MKVDVILNGYLIRDPETKLPLEASSTVTLLDDRLLIDTGSPIVRRELSRKIRGKNIEAILHTHHHIDHCGNDEIFPRAKIPDLRGDPKIGDFEVLMTPGHTPDSISICIKGDDGLVYVAAGDAIPTRNNFLRWVPPFLNYDEEEAIRSMERIVERADVIIPGHDKPFRNTKKRRSMTPPK